MKKLELFMGIALIIITTIIDVMFPFVVPYNSSNLGLICIFSALGYVAGYFLIDSYIGRLEMHHWTIGYEDGLKDAKDVKDYKRIY